MAACGDASAVILADRASCTLALEIQRLQDYISRTFKFGKDAGGFTYVTSALKSTMVGGKRGEVQPLHADGIVNGECFCCLCLLQHG